MNIKAVRFRSMIKIGKGLQKDAVATEERWCRSIKLDYASRTVVIVTALAGLHEAIVVPLENVTGLYPTDAEVASLVPKTPADKAPSAKQ